MSASRPLRHWWQPTRDGEHWGMGQDHAAEAALRRRVQALEARVREEEAARIALEARLAQAQRMQALGQLAGGVAHDFNHVLQAVCSGLALIERRPSLDPETLGRITDMMAKAAERGKLVTRRLLAFARRCEPAAEPVDVPALLRELHEMLACTLGSRIAVCVAAERDLPPALADKGQLETVLVNLVANARDAMPAAGGRITLGATAAQAWVGQVPAPSLSPGAYLRLSVADTGAGMDSMTLARAGEPFFTTKPPGQGTGLGLAMAREFAERSGGALVLTSAPGQGTTVSLWLPQAQAAAPGRRRRPAKP